MPDLVNGRRLGPLRGRDADIAQLRDMLDRSVPIIGVSGLPGVGKSRLVAHVLDKKTVWIDAAELEQSGDFSVIVDRCDVEVAQAAAQGRPAFTIVIDGLNRPDLGLQLTEFVDLNPWYQIVVTGRTPISVRGGSVLRLAPFPIPPRIAPMLARPDNWPSVQCFLDLASHADPTFKITPDNASDVLDVLRSTGGLPLALELLAPWLGIVSARELAWSCTDTGRLLERGSDDLPPSQRNLAKALRVGTELIPEHARSAALALAQFRAPATMTEIGRVLGKQVHLSDLADLLACGLVTATKGASTTKLVMFPVVAQHLRDTALDDAFQRRYQEWIVDRISFHLSRIGTSETASSIDAFGEHIDHLPDLELLLRDPVNVAQLTLELLPYWRYTGQHRESRRRLGTAMSNLAGDHASYQWLRLAEARANRDLGEVESARRTMMDIYQSLSLADAVRAAAALELLVLSRITDFSYPEELLRSTEHLLDASIAAASEPHSVPGLWLSALPAAVQQARAEAALSHRDLCAALTLYEGAVSLARSRDNRLDEFWALHMIVQIHRIAGDEQLEMQALSDQAAVAVVLGHATAELAHSRIQRSLSLAGHGHLSEARDEAMRGAQLIAGLDTPFDIVQGKRILGLVFAETGDSDRSRLAFAHCLNVCEVTSDRNQLAHLLVAISVAAPPVGPDADTRALLLATATDIVPDALAFAWGRWLERVQNVDVQPQPARAINDAIDLVRALLQSGDPPPTPSPAGLSARESEVLALLGERLTDREISERLSIGLRTTHTHVSSILSKLGATDRRAAGAWASDHGFVRQRRSQRSLPLR